MGWSGTPYLPKPSPAPPSRLRPKEKGPNISKNYQPHQYNHSCSWRGCDRRFVSQHNLNQHIREIHTGERPYVCFCGRTFPRPFGLNRHQSAVHGIENGVGKGGGRTKDKKKTTASKGEEGEMRENDGSVPDEALLQLANQLDHSQRTGSGFGQMFSNPDWMAASAFGLAGSEFLSQQGYQDHCPAKQWTAFDEGSDFPLKESEGVREIHHECGQGEFPFPLDPALLDVGHYLTTASDGQTNAMRGVSPFQMDAALTSTYQDLTPAIQSHPDGDVNVEVDSRCVYCYVDFDDLDVLMGHYHKHHGLPHIPACACGSCKTLFGPPHSTQAEVEPVLPVYGADAVSSYSSSSADFDEVALRSALNAWLREDENGL